MPEKPGSYRHGVHIAPRFEVVEGKTRVQHRQRIGCRQLDRIEKLLRDQGRHQLVVEATIGYDWFAGLAERFAERVVIAHAGKLRVIAQSTRKTDKIDAFVLAEFLAKQMIPEAWKPTPRVRQHRALVRRRGKVQSRITSIKNTMRSILTRYNADEENLFTVLGRKQAARLKLLEQDRFVLDDLWEDLDQQRQRLKKVDRRLAEFADTAPIQEAEARAVLATMPQVGPVTIETVLAELGDWRRFRNADARRRLPHGGLSCYDLRYPFTRFAKEFIPRSREHVAKSAS